MDSRLELIDQELLLKINSFRNDWVDVIMWGFSQVWVFFPLALLLLWVYGKRYGLRNTVALVLMCGLTVAFTDQTSYRVKNWVKRYRPTHHEELKRKVHVIKDWDGKEYIGGKYGFFSSHASNTVGVTTLLFLACSWVNKKWRYLFFIVPFLIIYSRMYMAVHYPSDVFVGALAGIVFGAFTFTLYRKYVFRSPLLDGED